ncbi:MAG: DUF5089 domain-containing protein [Rickettsiales bacterium]|nr:DUF5089 domain-containing protein [Rickettsiales bacterium]
MNSTNPVVTLRAQAEKFDFSKLRAGKDNAEANSGEQMYKDINRMGFVINSKSIDKILTGALIAGAKQREFDKIWNTHYENNSTPNQYKEFERFYNLGKEYTHLLPKEGDENKSYRPFAKEVFKEMFKYAEAKVPSDPILEELITSCNQSGYEFIYAPFIAKLLDEHELFMNVNGSNVDRKVYIDCRNPNSVKVECKTSRIPVNLSTEKISDMSFSLEFTIESQNDKDDVTYKDGKLLLIAPRELKNYKIDGKNLFDIIKEYFYKFCEKLGFKFEAKIEHSLGNPLEVNSHLKSVEPPVHNNEHGTVPGS